MTPIPEQATTPAPSQMASQNTGQMPAPEPMTPPSSGQSQAPIIAPVQQQSSLPFLGRGLAARRAERGQEVAGHNTALVGDTSALNKAIGEEAQVKIAESGERKPLIEQGVDLNQTLQNNLSQIMALREHTQKKLDAVEQASEAIAKDKIKDPWATKGLGSKIAALLAMTAGGYVAGRTGGSNQAAAMIDSAMRQDLDIQKYNLQNRREGVVQQQGLLKQMYDIYGDLDQAHTAAHVAAVDGLNKKLDAVSAKYASANFAAATKKAQALNVQNAQDKFEKYLADQQSAVDKLSMAEAANDVHIQQAKIVASSKANSAGAAQADKAAAVERLKSLVQRAQVQADKTGPLSPNENRIMDGLIAQIKQQMAQAAGKGVRLSGPVLKLFDEELPGNMERYSGRTGLMKKQLGQVLEQYSNPANFSSEEAPAEPQESTQQQIDRLNQPEAPFSPFEG